MSDNATDRAEIDPIEVLRFALGGATDAGTRSVEQRIAAGDDALRREVAGLGLTASVVREDARAGPSPAAMERLLATVSKRDPRPDPEQEEVWLQALPVPMPAGVRGPVRLDRVLHCDTPAFRLTVCLSSSSIDGGRAVDGQLVSHQGEPVSHVPIAWLVDGVEMEHTTSDGLGEFSFPFSCGTTFALRVEGAHGPRFINLMRDDDS